MNLTAFAFPSICFGPQESYGRVFSYLLNGAKALLDQGEIDFDFLMSRVRDFKCQNSFRSLFEHFYGKVLGYFQKSGLDAQKSSELAQETLLAVWNKSSLFDSSRGSCVTWVFTIARNLQSDYFRNLKRDVLAVSSQDLYEQSVDRSAQMDSSFLSVEVREQIDSLPVEQKEAVYAIYFDGFSHGEFAQRKQIPVGTVKSRIRLAVAHLKKVLGGS